MKWFRHVTRVVIGAGSLATFVGGWILFGHSGKPVSNINSDVLNAGSSGSTGNSSSASSIDPLPTLEPLPSLNSSSTVNNNSSALQPLPQTNFNFSARPMLRGRGS